MTALTTAALKETLTAALEDKMLSSTGTRVDISEGALRQALALIALAKDVTNYDESKFVEEDYEAAKGFLENFTTDVINGEVFHGVLQPIPEDLFVKSLEDARLSLQFVPPSYIITAVLMADLMTKHKHFYR